MIRRAASHRALIASLVLLTMALVVWSCTRDGGCDLRCEPKMILYSNSFESAADTVGWSGLGDMWLADDAPSAGGSRALGVAGGCIWPHAAYTLEPLEDGGRCTVRCWGKLVEAPGVVKLRIAGVYEDEIGFDIESPRWAPRSTSESIWCPAGKSPEVVISSGGFGQPGGVLVDLLEVVVCAEE
jgi:hypothetical protein